MTTTPRDRAVIALTILMVAIALHVLVAVEVEARGEGTFRTHGVDALPFVDRGSWRRTDANHRQNHEIPGDRQGHKCAVIRFRSY